MRRVTLGLNLLSAVLFLAFFTYTFVGRIHLESIARDFVTEKTLEYSGPVIDTVEKALEFPLVGKLLTNEEIAIIRVEIDAYRKAPATYVADLTGRHPRQTPENGAAIAQKAADAKAAIRRFYNDTLSALILDLRIFSGSNIVAACMALFFVANSKNGIRRPLIVFSYLLFVAVVFCSYLYIDDMSFFRILTSSHMGWWYPVFVIVFSAWLYRYIGSVIVAAT